ncbi:hypothetical protein BD414DRAFT_485491 [Trametes punicea]|nr:hypothetical protein BD414DRAFT_485491 [Trametes punicea]
MSLTHEHVIGSGFGSSAPPRDHQRAQLSLGSHERDEPQDAVSSSCKPPLPLAGHSRHQNPNLALTAELEAFTMTLIRTLLHRRKRDSELTREECALFRLLEGRREPLSIDPELHVAIQYHLRAMQLAELARPPGADPRGEGRGLVKLSDALLRLLYLHHQHREEPRALQDNLQQEEPNAWVARHYRAYLDAMEALHEAIVTTQGTGRDALPVLKYQSTRKNVVCSGTQQWSKSIDEQGDLEDGGRARSLQHCRTIVKDNDLYGSCTR